MDFTDFKLKDTLLESIEMMGYKAPTPIQEAAIPLIKSNKDLIGCAQTGTGKTAAFLIPIINNFLDKSTNKVRCLIIVPTRELAVQIDQQLDGFSYFCPISSISVYGGGEAESFNLQKNAIQQGADILIATPGRLLSHINLGYVDLSAIETLVLDEADRMLDMGFIDDIIAIIKKLPNQRQTLLFSATMSPKIRKFAKTILTNPEEVNLAVAKPAANIKQTCYLVYNENKIKLIEHIVNFSEVQNMIIFASRKISVDEIYRALKKLKLSVQSVHSGKDQTERNETVRLFKAGKIKIIVATDVLSRGIDIEGLSHVLNYDIPGDAADYVHRIGRTARADNKGEAISFINTDDQLKFADIEALIDNTLDKLETPKEKVLFTIQLRKVKSPIKNSTKSLSQGLRKTSLSNEINIFSFYIYLIINILQR